MPTADREDLAVDRDALRQEIARLGFNGWYGRAEYDEHPVQGMWERTADAQLAGPLLSAALAQADTAAQAVAERDEARARLLIVTADRDEQRRARLDAEADSETTDRWRQRALAAEAKIADIARLSAEAEALRRALNDVAGKAELARTIYETEEAATPSYVADAFGVIERFANSALAAGQDKTGGGKP